MNTFCNFNELYQHTVHTPDTQCLVFNDDAVDEDPEARKIANEFTQNFNTIYPDIKRLEQYVNEEFNTIVLEDLSANQLNALIKSLDTLSTCTKTMKKNIKAWLKTDFYKNK